MVNGGLQGSWEKSYPSTSLEARHCQAASEGNLLWQLLATRILSSTTFFHLPNSLPLTNLLLHPQFSTYPISIYLQLSSTSPPNSLLSLVRTNPWPTVTHFMSTQKYTFLVHPRIQVQEKPLPAKGCFGLGSLHMRIGPRHSDQGS